jgi:hypothetical protein
MKGEERRKEEARMKWGAERHPEKKNLGKFADQNLAHTIDVPYSFVRASNSAIYAEICR